MLEGKYYSLALIIIYRMIKKEFIIRLNYIVYVTCVTYTCREHTVNKMKKATIGLSDYRVCGTIVLSNQF